MTGSDAVLVGGAAVAILTDGTFMSGDFDIVAGADKSFHHAMVEHGFRLEDQPGFLKKGYFHPDWPEFGFEPVSGALFDARADRRRLIHIRLAEVAGEISLPSVEDMIADRLAQHEAVSTPTDNSRLMQARLLFHLAEDIDTAYLLKRIRDEGGNAALLGVQK